LLIEEIMSGAAVLINDQGINNQGINNQQLRN